MRKPDPHKNKKINKCLWVSFYLSGVIFFYSAQSYMEPFFKMKTRNRTRSVDIKKHVNEIIVVQRPLPSSLPFYFTACCNARFEDCFLRL